MPMLRSLALALSVSVAAAYPALAQETAAPAEQSYTPTVGMDGKDVIWVPTPQALVDRMLAMGNVTADDYVVDLGSGDGRTVISVAKLGARAHGIEYNPDLVELSKKNAEEAGVADRATFVEADIFESDFSDATVVTLFLLTDLNIKLRPTLLDMKPGTRVLSNTFNMGDWEPDDMVDAGGDCESWCRAYKWIVPAKVDGEWDIDGNRLSLEQNYQMLSGSLTVDGAEQNISDAKMAGTEISFSVGDQKYTGSVENDTITGTADNGEEWVAKRVAD